MRDKVKGKVIPWSTQDKQCLRSKTSSLTSSQQERPPEKTDQQGMHDLEKQENKLQSPESQGEVGNFVLCVWCAGTGSLPRLSRVRVEAKNSLVLSPPSWFLM